MNMIRILSIEIYKCVQSINPDEMFSLSNSHYDCRDHSRLEQPKFNTRTFGYRSFKNLGSKLYLLLLSYFSTITISCAYYCREGNYHKFDFILKPLS